MKTLFAFALPVLLAAGAGSLAIADSTDVGTISADNGVIYKTDQVGVGTQGFFDIVNNGSTADTLTKAQCQVADTTSLVGTDGKPVGNLAVPAGQTVSLSAKGPHLILQSTHFVIQTGSAVPCTLSFAGAGDIQVLLYSQPPPS
jgi:copper(I)-binding protein